VLEAVVDGDSDRVEVEGSGDVTETSGRVETLEREGEREREKEEAKKGEWEGVLYSARCEISVKDERLTVVQGN